MESVAYETDSGKTAIYISSSVLNQMSSCSQEAHLSHKLHIYSAAIMSTYIECPEGHKDTVRGLCEPTQNFPLTWSSHPKSPWYCCWSNGRSTESFWKFKKPVVKPKLKRHMIKCSDCAACRALSQQGIKNEKLRRTVNKACRISTTSEGSRPLMEANQPRNPNGVHEETSAGGRHRRESKDRCYARDFEVKERRLRLGKWSEMRKSHAYSISTPDSLDGQMFESTPLMPMLDQDRGSKIEQDDLFDMFILHHDNTDFAYGLTPESEIQQCFDGSHSQCFIPWYVLDEPYVHLGLDEERWTQIQEGAGHGIAPPREAVSHISLAIRTRPASCQRTEPKFENHSKKTKEISMQGTESSPKSKSTYVSQQVLYSKHVSSSRPKTPVWSTTITPSFHVSTVASMLSMRSRLAKHFTAETNFDVGNFLKFLSLSEM